MNLFQNKNIRPMLLYEQEKPFDDEDYLFEIKFDGFRAFVFADTKQVTIISRNGVILNHTYPELESIKEIVTHPCIFDGEIVAMENGIPSFWQLQKRAHLKDSMRIKKLSIKEPVTFVCFDILYDGADITSEPLLKRKKHLESFIDTESFIKTKYVIGEGKKLFSFVKEKGLEGIVAKKKDSIYQVGERSRDWIKIKNVFDDDFLIGGYEIPLKGSLANLLLGEKRNGKIIFVGRVAIGKNNPDFQIIKKQQTLEKSPFFDFEDHAYTYIQPSLLCCVIYSQKTKSNHLRHAVYKGLK